MGALTPITGSAILPGVDGPRGITVHPNGKALYLSVSNQDEIFSYAIDPTSGALTPLAGSPLATLHGPSPLQLVSNGTHAALIFTAEATTQTVENEYRVDPASGVLTEFGAGYTNLGLMSFDIADPEGRLTYAIGRNSHPANDTIEPICVDVSCFSQASWADVPLNAQISWCAADPSGRFLYLTDTSGNALAFVIDRITGKLTPGATSANAFVPLHSVVITTK
jgi:6-phosphogluconolactonase (cycloisomerase 2 family)